MAQDYSITIGTCGRGTWNSMDSGESWMLQRKWFFPPESPIVRALVIHPSDPHTLYAGGDLGLHRSTDNGRNWEMISTPGELANIWSIAIDPKDPETMFVGTSPTGLYRSRDGGYRWVKLTSPELVEECEVGAPRVTQVAIDPDDTRVIWAGIEVDGILRSLDGGDSWTRIAIPDDDIHSIVVNKTDQKRVLALTPRALYVSTDMGESWDPMGTKRFANKDNHGSYQRLIIQKPDDHRVMFMGTGNFNVGSAGNIFRSTDAGRTWENVKLPNYTNSTVFGLHINPANTDRVVANSCNGEVWASEDLGDSWRKVDQVFGEVLCITWQPNSESVGETHSPVGMQAGLDGEVIMPPSS